MTPLSASLLGFAVVCALALIYPYVIYPALLALMPTRPTLIADPTPEDGSQFAVLFCAYNEERSAAEKVANLTALMTRYPQLQVLIYDDGSTDRTHEIFSSLGPGIVQRGPGRTGKALGMQQLVRSTTRPILVFTDANVMLDPSIIEKAAPYFSDEAVGGVCGHLVYTSGEHTATQVAGGAYWRLEERIKRLESRTGNVMGGDGSIFVVRRSLYPAVPETAQDDFTVTMNVVMSGRRLVVADELVAREELVARSSDEYRRKVRIAARAAHTHLTMRGNLRRMSMFDRWKYVSHKIIRWLGAFFLVAGLVAGVAGAMLLSPTLGATVLAVALLAGTLLVTVPALAPVREVVLAILATGQGVVLALRGKTFATWTPPQSR